MGNSTTRGTPSLPTRTCDNALSVDPTSTKDVISSHFGRNIARQRFYNAHHTWNECLDSSGHDVMLDFIKRCPSTKSRCQNLSMFHVVVSQCLESVRSLCFSAPDPEATTWTAAALRARTKKVLRCMRLLSAWMTVAITNDKLWVFRDLGALLHGLYHEAGAHSEALCRTLSDHQSSSSSNGMNGTNGVSGQFERERGQWSRIQIDYERIMGELLCQCTLKRRLSMLKFLALELSVDVNLQCEGGESPLILCAEHNLPEMALFLLHCGADANCNIYLSSDSSNSPAQIASSWQHLKVLFYLILFGARSSYFNVHLRSVEQYATNNHLINYVVQKALTLRLQRHKMIRSVLFKELCHPDDWRHILETHSLHDALDKVDVDYFQFPFEDEAQTDSVTFAPFHFASSDDNEQVHRQIRSNIDQSIKFMKAQRRRTKDGARKKSRRGSKHIEVEGEGERHRERRADRVYLLRDIVHIIFSMIACDVDAAA